MRIFIIFLCLLFLSCGTRRSEADDFYDDEFLYSDIDELFTRADEYPLGSSSEEMLILLDRVLYYLPSSSSDRLIMQVHQITRVLKDRGNLNTFITYLSSYERLVRFDAFIMTKDGKKQSASNIETRKPFDNDFIELPLYKGVKVLSISFDGVEAGSTVHLRYEMDTSYRELQGGSFYLSSHHPILKRKYAVKLPAGMELYHKSIATDVSPQVIKNDSYNYYIFESDNIEYVPREDYSPPLSSISGRVIFSRYKDWSSFVPYLLSLFPVLKPSEISKRIRDLSEGLTILAKDDDERARILYNYVTGTENIRNIILPFGFGEARPFSPDLVLDGAYGDIKDKAYLLYAMLRSIGINAYIAFTNEDEDLDKDIVSLSSFNKVLVVILGKDGRYLYMDPHSVLLRFSYLPSKLYGRRVFILGLDDWYTAGGTFRRIPYVSFGDNGFIYSYRSRLSFRGMEYTGKYVPRGDFETRERLRVYKVKFKNRFESLEENYRAVYSNDNFDVLSFESSDPSNLDETFHYSLKALLSDYSIESGLLKSGNHLSGRRIYINPDLDGSVPLFGSLPKSMRNNFHYPLPFSVFVQNVISYDRGISLYRLPRSVSYSNSFFDYKRVYKRLRGRRIKYTRRFALKKNVISRDDYSIFADLVRKVSLKDKERIIFSLSKRILEARGSL